MLKRILLISAITLLSACGGSGSSSSDESATPNSTTAATLTFDTRYLDYAAIKIADGEWQQVTPQLYTFNSTNPGGSLEVSLLTVCDDGDDSSHDFYAYVDIINLTENTVINNRNDCNATGTPPVSVITNVDSGPTIDDLSVTNSISNSSADSGYNVILNGESVTSDIAATSDSTTGMYLYTASGITLTSGETLAIDITIPLTELVTVDGDISYYLPGTSSGLYLSDESSSAYKIPTENRVSGDFYQLSKEVLDESYYVANLADIDSTVVPVFSAYAVYDNQLTADGNTITWQIAQLSDSVPDGYTEGKLITSGGTEEQYLVYLVDTSLMNNGTYSLDLVDFNSLPDFPFSFEAFSTAEFADGWDLQVDNGEEADQRNYKSVTLFSRPDR